MFRRNPAWQHAGPGVEAPHDEARLRRDFWAKLNRVAAQLPFAEDLVAAYYCAFDRETPGHVKVALIGALAYFVLPFDAVADIMPMLGFADDAAVLATALRLVATHVRDTHREAARNALDRVRETA
ncbi:MAG: hypothetical protein BroJett030_04860 [Alphaproteobacteria bacterium]|nr:MAG: hypothetical protein BroJett030_04860 [Alphaproteobacteria bacterium]